jgi:hypothetical protein
MHRAPTSGPGLREKPFFGAPPRKNVYSYSFESEDFLLAFLKEMSFFVHGRPADRPCDKKRKGGIKF